MVLLTIFNQLLLDCTGLVKVLWPISEEDCLERLFFIFSKNTYSNSNFNSSPPMYLPEEKNSNLNSIMYLPGASLVAQRAKNLPAMQETWVWFLDQDDPLKKRMATHSSIPAWEIPWAEEPGRLQSMGTPITEWLTLPTPKIPSNQVQ